MNRILAGVFVFLLGGVAIAQEKGVPFPGEEALYFYRAELNQVVDGATVTLDLDLGFFVWLHRTQIRLHGIEVQDRTSAEGRRAAEWLTEQLRDASELGELRVKTYPAPEGSEVAWLGVLFASGKNLNREMLAQGLAKASQPE